MAEVSFQILGKTIPVGTIRDLLLLVDIDVSEECILLWSDTERTFALNWAEACHLSASDNVLNEYCRAHDEDANYDQPFKCICRPPKPEFLNQYPKPSFEQNFPLLTRSAE